MCLKPKITIENSYDAAQFKQTLDKYLVNYSVRAEPRGWIFKIKGQSKRRQSL